MDIGKVQYRVMLPYHPELPITLIDYTVDPHRDRTLSYKALKEFVLSEIIKGSNVFLDLTQSSEVCEVITVIDMEEALRITHKYKIVEREDS